MQENQCQQRSGLTIWANESGEGCGGNGELVPEIAPPPTLIFFFLRPAMEHERERIWRKAADGSAR